MVDYGVGSRGIITFRYAKGGAGHTFNVVQTSNGTKYIDAQIGKELSASQALKGASIRTVTLYRTDDRPIDPNMASRAFRRR